MYLTQSKEVILTRYNALQCCNFGFFICVLHLLSVGKKLSLSLLSLSPHTVSLLIHSLHPTKHNPTPKQTIPTK